MIAIVLTFDCLPVRLLGCYGNQVVATRNFDRLAADSIVFDSHFGENFSPAAENHAWWTGRYQFPRTPDQQRNEMLLQTMLSEAGVNFQIISEQSSIADLIDHGRSVIESIASNKHAPQLLWLEATGVSPADQSEVAGIASIDNALGKLLDCIERCVAFEKSLFILTAARGSRLTQSIKRMTHSIELNESLVQVPLFIRAIDCEMGSRRNCLTQSVDLLPTLLEWLEIDGAPFDIEGQSLVPIVCDPSGGNREHVYVGYNRRERAIRTRAFYLVERINDDDASDSLADVHQHESATVYLFRKPEDRFEVHDVARQYPDVCDDLRKSLAAFIRRFVTGNARE